MLGGDFFNATITLGSTLRSTLRYSSWVVPSLSHEYWTWIEVVTSDKDLATIVSVTTVKKA